MQRVLTTKLPDNCFDCPMTSCTLPYSKVIPTRKRADFAYKRHPDCVLAKGRILETRDIPAKKVG